MYDDITVILPTLNEARSLPILAGYLLRKYPGIRVIVVDDGSSDGTRRKAMAMAKRNKSLRFYDRKRYGLEKGLTNSIIYGISKSRTRFVIAMDADLQHPPELIPKIVDSLRSGCEIAVACRSTVVGWELYRKIVSKILISIGYAVLIMRGSARCDDIFSGFFGTKRSLFIKEQRLRGAAFIGPGYKVLFDLLKQLPAGSVKTCSIPYVFHGRKYGKSKAGATQAFFLLKSFLS